MEQTASASQPGSLLQVASQASQTPGSSLICLADTLSFCAATGSLLSAAQPGEPFPLAVKVHPRPDLLIAIQGKTKTNTSQVPGSPWGLQTTQGVQIRHMGQHTHHSGLCLPDESPGTLAAPKEHTVSAVTTKYPGHHSQVPFRGVALGYPWPWVWLWRHGQLHQEPPHEWTLCRCPQQALVFDQPLSSGVCFPSRKCYIEIY